VNVPPERALATKQEIEQALADLPRLTRGELETIRVSINHLSTNERHRFFTELILCLTDEMTSLGKTMDQNRQAICEFDRTSQKLNKWLIGLTVVLVALTLAIAFFTVLLWVRPN